MGKEACDFRYQLLRAPHPVGDRLGSLEPGKAATFIVTTGDPLQITTQIERAWIDGREVELDSRQSELRDKYREKYRRQGRIAS